MLKYLRSLLTLRCIHQSIRPAAMSKCAVIGCKSIYNPFNGAISFHRVTKNKKYLPLWRQAVTMKSNSAQPKICSLHFKEKDFMDGRDRRVLKPNAVPSINIIDKDYLTDDEDDNKNLSLLKRILTTGNTSVNEDTTETTHSEDAFDTNQSQSFEMVMSCCDSGHSSNPQNAKHTSHIGIQTKIKTEKEISLQARVKLLELRLRRRDTKISYMQTVLNMIKKHTKGTDMEYKLCCELQNISEYSDAVTAPKDRRKGNCLNKTRAESPLSNASESSSEDTGSFIEVVHSSNLKQCLGF